MGKERRIEVWNKFKGHCAYCGEEIELREMQVDHIIPKGFFINQIKNKFGVPDFLKHLSVDDVNHIDNLFPSCRVCNKWKSAHHLELFRTELQSQVKRLNEYSSNYRIAKKYGLIVENDIKVEFYFER